MSTGKALIEKGGLKQRVTIIPLDSVSSRLPDASVLSSAKQTANATLALELVGSEVSWMWQKKCTTTDG